MDRSEDRLASQGGQWVTLERAAELARSVMPRTLALEIVKDILRQRAADESLRCRDPRTRQVVVPLYDVRTYGNPFPEPFRCVEIEVQSLRRYLLQLHTEEHWSDWSLPVDDILNLGNEDVDPSEVLDRRLLTVASAELAPVERGKMTARSATERNKGGNPGKPFREELGFLVGFRITELKSPDLRSVKSLILRIATTRGWQLSGDSPHEWARTYMGWYERRNRET